MDLQVLLPSSVPARERRLGGAEVDELIEHLFAPPIVDPGQMPTGIAGRIESGEMRLALAVLEDALRRVLCHFRSPIGEQRQGAREALSWIQCDDEEPPFAFVRICQLFDLDPSWLRAKVRSRIGHARGVRSSIEEAA